MTPTQIKTAAFRKLQLISPDMPVDASDMSVMTDKYAGLHAQLLAEELVTWSLTENIPAKAEQPIISMLSAYAANEFGITDPRYSQLLIEGGFQLPVMSLAERQLRAAINGRYVNSPVATEYF